MIASISFGLFVLLGVCILMTLFTFISEKSEEGDNKIRAGHIEVENKRLLAQRHGMILNQELYRDGTEEYMFPPSMYMK